MKNEKREEMRGKWLDFRNEPVYRYSKIFLVSQNQKAARNCGSRKF